MALKPLHRVDPDAAVVTRDGAVTLNGRVLGQTVNGLSERTGGVTHRWLVHPVYTVAELTAMAAETPAPPNGATAICSDETGGRTLASFDSAAGLWKRVSDGAGVS